MSQQDPAGRDKETGAAVQAIVAQVTQAMSTHGFGVVAVGPEGNRPPFAYTVGLETGFGHPEIVLVGDFAARIQQGVLNAAGARVKAGSRFLAGERSREVVPRYDVAFGEVLEEAAAEHLQIAELVEDEQLGRPTRAVQMFLPDAAGRFPWDKGCEPRMAKSQTGLALGPLPKPAKARKQG
jgi:hypothetical protein